MHSIFNKYYFFQYNDQEDRLLQTLERKKQNRVSSPKMAHNTEENYSKVEENSCYQELGDVSKPTFYETMA